MAKQVFGRNGQPAGTSSGGGSGGGGNANVYITIPNVDIKDILLIGTQAKVKVSASTFDVDNSVVYFDLRIDNTQVLLDAVKDGKMWKAEYTFTVAGQSGDRLAVFCNAIDQNSLRSMTGTPAISPRLTESYIAAPVITSPVAGEYKTAGSIVIKGTEFVSLGAPDTQKAIHGRVVLADDPQIVRWEGSLGGALTQITASWTPAGEGQEDLLCSIAYEGYSGGMGLWSEPVRVKLVKSGVSVPVITWPLNGEKYADPNLLRCNAEQPTVKSNSWTGTEWQVSDYADFSNLLVAQSITDTDILPNRVLVDLKLDSRLDKQLHLRCRHLTNVGPTAWSDVISFQTASHQAFWEFTASGTFTPPVDGVYEVLCVGSGGKGGAKNGTTNSGGGGGGGSGYISTGQVILNTPIEYEINNTKTSLHSVVASVGQNGKTGPASGVSIVNGGDGGNGGGGGGNASVGCIGGRGATGGDGGNGGVSYSVNGSDGKNNGGKGGVSNSAGSNGGGGGGGGAGGGNGVGQNGSNRGAGYGGGGVGESGSGYGGYGGGGGGGYGGGTNFTLDNYYSKYLPYKNFNNITTGIGYVRIMYKGPIGEGA